MAFSATLDLQVPAGHEQRGDGGAQNALEGTPNNAA